MSNTQRHRRGDRSGQAGNVFGTADLLHDAAKHLAYGADLAKLRPLFHGQEESYPQFIQSTSGCRLVDTNDRSYLDWASGFGAVLFGYGDRQVADAVREQLDFGPTLSMPHRLEVEVAKLIVATVPCAEKVSFGKNGSDAVTAAVRIARSATGREIVLVGGYHGFHDWYQASHPELRGIPTALRRTLRPFPYNDLGFVERMFHQQRDRIAAIVVEPTRNRRPAAGYLQGLRELADRHQAVLIFDEVVTGFRLANGGAQELYGVIPDIACIGKCLAHGFPLSAVVGSAPLMDHYPAVGAGMTFRNEAVALGVARHVLQRLRTSPAAEQLAATGEQLRQHFDATCSNLGIDGRLSGHPALLHLHFENHGDATGADLEGLFMDAALKKGLITNGAFIPTCSHDQESLDETKNIIEQALDVVARKVGSTGSLPCVPPTPWVQGCLDFLEESEAGLRAVGWLLCETGPRLKIGVRTRTDFEAEATALLRTDVAEEFPYCEGAVSSGFEVVLPADSFDSDQDRSFIIEGRRDGALLFRCLVACDRPSTRVSGPITLHRDQLIIVAARGSKTPNNADTT